MRQTDQATLKRSFAPIEISVSITGEMRSALSEVANRKGLRASPYARQALFEALVRDGFLKPQGWPFNEPQVR